MVLVGFLCILYQGVLCSHGSGQLLLVWILELLEVQGIQAVVAEEVSKECQSMMVFQLETQGILSVFHGIGLIDGVPGHLLYTKEV